MKTAALAALLPAAPVLAVTAAAGLPPAESEAAQGWWLIVALSLLSTITTIAVNFITFSQRNKPVELAQPVLTEMRRELATKDDVSRAKAFTGRVQAALTDQLSDAASDMRSEIRRLYDKLDPLEATLAAHTARLDSLDQAARESRGILSGKL